MKAFFASAMRLAFALFLAALSLAIVIAAYSWAQDFYRQKQATPYESIKVWSSDLSANLGLKIAVRTKLVASKLLLSAEIDGYPTYLSDPKMKERNSTATFKFNFLDSDGFIVFTKSVQMNEFSGIVSDSGERTGMRVQLEEFSSLDDYKRFQSMQVEWTLDTKTSPTLADESMKEQPLLLDHCAPKLSRMERMKRLAQYGELRDAGNDTYTAGNRTMTFFDGSLLYCH